MNLYSIALFFHIVGALGFFIALALEWVSLQQLQRVSTVEQLEQWFKTTSGMRGIGGISMLIILIAGFYMTFVAWGGAQWISVAFIAMIVMGAISGLVSGRRMRAIKTLMAGQSGPLSPDLDRAIFHPALWISMLTRVSMALGIVFLMSVKPVLLTSLIVMSVATLLGLAASFFMGSSRRGQTAIA